MGRKDRNKNKGISVDLSGVEVGSKKALPEGNYSVSVDSIEIKESSNSGANYMAFTFEVEDGPSKGAKLFHNCSLQPQALFNLKAVLLALGFEIPNKAFDLDTSALVGLSCMVEVAHEVYEGKKKARIVDFINPEDADDDDSDSEVDLESLDKDELKQLAKALGISDKKVKKAKTEEDLIELIEECDEEELAEKYEELFGEDDDEEEESDEDEDEDSDSQSLEDLDMDQLKELAKHLKINAKKVKKCKDEESLIELIEDEAEEDDVTEGIEELFGDEDSDSDDEGEDKDYESMEIMELKIEAKERGLKVPKKATKEDIIELLEEDDEE